MPKTRELVGAQDETADKREPPGARRIARARAGGRAERELVVTGVDTEPRGDSAEELSGAGAARARRVNLEDAVEARARRLSFDRGGVAALEFPGAAADHTGQRKRWAGAAIAQALGLGDRAALPVLALGSDE